MTTTTSNTEDSSKHNYSYIKIYKIASELTQSQTALGGLPIIPMFSCYKFHALHVCQKFWKSVNSRQGYDNNNMVHCLKYSVGETVVVHYVYTDYW